jgi:elongation factor P hydroxylase
MTKPLSKAELIHYKIQAAMRENVFAEDQMKYLGERDGTYWYLIDGQHKVSADQFEEFEVEE